MPTPTCSHANAPDDDDGYVFLRTALERSIAQASGPLFNTDVDPRKLWKAFLKALPKPRRQHYRCHACREFVRRYGGIVTRQGKPLLWGLDTRLGEMHPSASRARALVRTALVVSVFYTEDPTLGVGCTPPWYHMSGTLPAGAHSIHASLTESASQRTARSVQEQGTLSRFLRSRAAKALPTALELLRGGDLPGAAKVLPWAEWLYELRRARPQQVWHAVATAPPGWCAPSSSMLGSLLADIANGKSHRAVRDAWVKRTDPLNYQRSKALPTAGNVARANQVVEALGLAPSLRRRVATVDDVLRDGDILWRPTPAAPAVVEGAFGHVRTKTTSDPETYVPAALRGRSPQTMSWAVFARDVLSSVTEMQVRIGMSDGFHGMAVGVNPDAPPLLKWNHGYSWWTYSELTSCTPWGLRSGFLPVALVCPMPCHWHASAAHQQFAPGVMFFTPGTVRGTGRSFFVSQLRGEFHEVRATLEQHAAQTPPEGLGEAGAAVAVVVRKGAPQGRALRVKVRGSAAWRSYTIDRWE